MKKPSLIVLGILIAAQLSVPFTMIQGREKILNEGELFKFKTRPIDPADPFQGRYVRLDFTSNHIPWPKDRKTDLRRNEAIFANLEVDADGFASFTGWSREKQETGNYLKVRYVGVFNEWNSSINKRVYKGLRISIPFNRFYMDEAKAPRAEVLAREATRTSNCWVNVRILNGKAVIEDVFAEGQSLRDLAAKKE